MGGLCGAVSSVPQTTASSERSRRRGRSGDATGFSAISQNIAADLSMGLSTFGQGKERQAATLKAQGYSDKAIKDYQDRTAASMARMREEMAKSSKDDNDSSPAPAPAPTPAPAPAATTPAMTEAEEQQTSEDKVADDIASASGRASTIATTAQGLMTEAKTTGGKSLLGGKKKKNLLA